MNVYVETRHDELAHWSYGRTTTISPTSGEGTSERELGSISRSEAERYTLMRASGSRTSSAASSAVRRGKFSTPTNVIGFLVSPEPGPM